MDHLNNESIAIVGSGCRFPGNANTPTKLWELLKEPKDVLSRIPEDRFNPSGFYHPDGLHHGTSNVQDSYFLSENLRHFDAQFFGVKPVEANAIDPQQRLLIETVYESLEAAGIPIKSLSGSDTSVFVGLMCEDYSLHLRRDPDVTPIYTATGIARSIIANRLSYFFDWHGPSVTIDTACSSSLVAVHQAVQSLRSGESQVALAAGANLILTPELYIAESNLKMLSAGSRSKMWDADADGYARGEGIAAIVLKRLSDAIRNGDNIECIIRETGVNQDGHTNGITMPSAAAQTTLIQDTYARAGLDISNPADRCQYFEAHGTGTPAGDPREAEAISKAFFGPEAKSSDPDDILYVGSIKTVVGHTEGTAGLAGLLKASLGIQHGIIPPNLLFNHLSPSVAPFYTNLEIPTKPIAWPVLPVEQPRRASVNSFGFGGTNAHAIIESFTPSGFSKQEASISIQQPSAVFTPFTFSAASERSLASTLKEFSSFLKQTPVNLRDLSYTLHSRRSEFAFKTSFSASSIEGLCAAIDGTLDETARESGQTLAVRSTPGAETPAILGVFTGQGAQWTSMGSRLIAESEFVRKSIDGFDHVLAQLPLEDRPQWSIKDELLADSPRSRLNEAYLSQPLCTAIQIILVDMLRSAGIVFKAVVGHSSGEIAAAYASGFISASDAIKISYYRGFYAKLAGNGAGIKGAMLAVGTSLEDAEEVCQLPEFEGRVSVAANNSPSSLTLSGDSDAIDELKVVFEDEKKFARILKVDTAYHSHHMIPCSEPYMKALESCKIEVNPNGGSFCSWVSSVHGGKIMNASDGLHAAYWKDNMIKPVLFAQAVQASATIDANNYDLALEVGPHPALQGPVLQTLPDIIDHAIPYSGTLSRWTDDIESFSNMLGFVWARGGQAVVDFNGYRELVCGATSPNVAKHLPAYSWDHDREYWIDTRLSKAFCSRSTPTHELLGTRCIDTADEYRWRNNLREREIPWLSGHKLQGQTVFPAAGYVSTAFEAAKIMAESQEIKLLELQDFTIGRAISFNDDDDMGVETLVTLTKVFEASSDDRYILADFKYHSTTSYDSAAMALNASGLVCITLGEASPTTLPPRSSPAPNLVPLESDLFYSTLHDIGYQYTGSFQALTEMKRSLGFGTGLVSNPPCSELEDCFLVHPAMLDAALQATFLAFCWPGDGSLRELHVPTALRRIRLNPCLCHTNSSKEVYLPLDSIIPDVESSKIIGDVEIFPENGKSAMLQVEGISIMPFSSAVETNDRQMFSTWVLDIDNPNGADAMKNNRASREEYNLASILEQASVYFLRHLRSVITAEEINKSEWHHKKLFEFADHVISGVKNGSQPFSKTSWMDSTREEIYDLMARFPESIELKLVRTVGEHLPAAVRGEVNILEYLMEDNLLNDFYEHGHGIIEHTEFCANMVEQIVHRYPNMKILEIGAGTGGATKKILKRIGQKFSSYTFTDISTGFFEKAQEIFSDKGNKMIFKSLDCEKDILDQGYVEHSYDLIVASLVLHATEYLEKTLENVRRLLKPGGFLVMLELTADGPMRFGFCMSGLPGWWLGHKDGRKLSPLATSAQWHTVLQKTGFSGVDAITPEVDVLARPCFVIATQAVGDQINFLRQPLQSQKTDLGINHLVILGGAKLETMKLVDRLVNILRPLCNQITKVRTLKEVTENVVGSRSHVLNLTDLDEPIFKSTSGDMIESLKYLLRQAKTMLWVTRGCKKADPYANMSIGFGRALALEMPFIRTQFLDITSSETPDTNLIGESMLRLCVTDSWESDGSHYQILWSHEPEIFQQDGKVLIPRLYHLKEANDRYNSRKRIIKKEATLETSTIVLFRNELSYAIRASQPGGTKLPGDFIVVNVQYSLIAAIRLSSSSYNFVVFGSDALTGEKVCAVSESNASQVTVPVNWATVCNVPIGGEIFISIVAQNFVAHYICSLGVQGKTLVVHEPDSQLVPILQDHALQRGLDLLLTTSISNHPSETSLVFIHPLSSQRELKSIIPKNISAFVNLCSSSLGPEFLNALPSHCNCLIGSDLFSEDATSLLQDPVETIRLIRNIADVGQKKANSLPAVVTIRDVIDVDRNFQPFTVIDWTNCSPISITVQPIDSTPLFARDRTYVLFGLTSDLAQTLCHWMVQHGARYVAMTSRKPNVQQAWLNRVEALGATVKLFPNDISNFQDLERVCKTITDTLPQISGIANGAMVLVDTLIEDLDVDSLETVLKPKVKGSINLEKIFGDADLDFFIMLSSIAAIYGNERQSNYGIANTFMTGLAYQRRARGRAASILHIGPIVGSGYITREASENTVSWIRDHGHLLLSERDFVQGFGEAILIGRPESNSCPEIVLDERAPIIDLESQSKEINDPKFRHILKIIEDSGSGQEGGSSSIPVKIRLMSATSPEQLIEELQNSFIEKLQILLQLTIDDTKKDDILGKGANDLGIDSLIAVDLRTWFLKELDVDMPVLKILGGMSVQELLAFTVEKLPEKLTSSLSFKISDTYIGKLQPGAIPSNSDKSPESSGASHEDQSSTSGEPNGQSSSVISSISTASEDSEKKSQVFSSALPSFVRSEPMSFGQSRLWSMMALLEDPTALNIACFVRMTGNVRVSDLERAVHDVSQAHEALRTCFFEDTSHRFTQGVLSATRIHLESRQIRDGDAFREFEQIKGHVFDIESGEGLRVVLLSENPRSHYIIIIYHHIVMDGVSLEIFLSDLQKAYNRQPLPSKVLQYPDFALRQLKSFQSGGMASELRFWQKEFPNIPSPLPLLPFSDVCSRQSLTRYNFNSVSNTISGSLSSRIKGTCRKYKTTPFHFFLATYKALLFRFLRSEDLCIGMADANRLDSDAMSGIGCYLNLLPLRFTAKEDQKFSAAIQEVRAKSYAAIANSSIPFDVLLEELHVPRTSLHSPLFQTFINYRQGVTEKRMFGETEAEAQDYLIAKTAYDISLDIIDNPGGNSTVSFMVQKDLYGVKHAQILIDCYVRLLEAFSISPETKIATPSLYSTEDLEKAIDTGRGPTTKSQWPKTLIDRVDDVIRDHADETALADDLGHTLSYKEMGGLVDTIASTLLIRGVSPGANIAVCQEPSVDWVCSMLAIMRVGGVYVPLDLRISVPRLQTIVKDCTPVIILAHELSHDIAGDVNVSGAEIINLSSIPTLSVVVPIRTEPEAAAAIYYTSGSTGIPKGITLKHSSLVNVIEDCADTYNLRAQSVLQQSALSFDMSLWQTFNALANGGVLHVVSKTNRVDPDAVARLFTTENIAVTLATPSEYVSWLRAGSLDELRKSIWDVAVVGGEQLTEGHLHAFQELAHPKMRLFHAYGPTEVTFISSTMELPYIGLHLSKPFPVGLTCRNCSIYIVNEDMQLVPAGSPGEVLIGGAGVSMGYLNNKELTKQKFFPDIYASSESKSKMVHRTGDRGRLRQDGALIIEGRIDGDTQIKLRGIRIDLQDIESTIIRTSNGAIIETIVSLHGDSQVLIAHIVFSPEHSPSSRDLFLQNLLFSLPLPQYMVPAALIPLDSLPITDHGKVDRLSIAKLPLPEHSHGGNDNFSRPLSETELRLKQCWEDVLSKDITGIYQVHSNTDFFHIGGNSGLLVRLHRSIQKSFGVTLRLIELFETSTLWSMAAKIDHSATERVIDWEQETKVDRALFLRSSTLKVSNKKSLDGKVVLLTGATGNLGGALLLQLVSEPTVSTIHCIALRPLDESMPRALPILSPKIITHYGDLAAPDLGLSGSDFETLAATVDVIIHCGAQRSFWEYYQALRAVNVGSTRSIVHLAQSRQIPIHFLSSGGVFTLGNAGFYEGSVAHFSPPTDGSNGYVASKWAAERYLETATSELGVPVTIHRPLAAPDNTHQEPPSAIVEEFLDLARSMSALPSRDGWTGDFDLLSLQKVVDDIAASAIASAASSEGAGTARYFHHNADIHVSVRDLFTKVEDLLASDSHVMLDTAERIPAIEWMGRAKKAGLKYMIAAQNLVFEVDGNESSVGLVSKR